MWVQRNTEQILTTDNCIHIKIRIDRNKRENSPLGAAAGAADPPAAGAAELETATAPPDGTLASLL